MTSSIQGTVLSDIVRWEPDKNYARDDLTIASGQNLKLGTVLGKVTASGEYAQLNPSATDGTETAAGILLGDVDASQAEQPGVALVRESIILQEYLVWPDGITDDQKATALGQLKDLGIVIRTGV